MNTALYKLKFSPPNMASLIDVFVWEQSERRETCRVRRLCRVQRVKACFESSAQTCLAILLLLYTSEEQIRSYYNLSHHFSRKALYDFFYNYQCARIICSLHLIHVISQASIMSTPDVPVYRQSWAVGMCRHFTLSSLHHNLHRVTTIKGNNCLIGSCTYRTLRSLRNYQSNCKLVSVHYNLLIYKSNVKT